MGNKELYKMAYEAMIKIDECKKSLQSYLDEVKKTGQAITKEMEEHIQGINENLIYEMNKHTQIYRQIYEVK